MWFSLRLSGSDSGGNKQNPDILERQNRIFLPQSLISFLLFCIPSGEQDSLRQSERKYFVDIKMHENYAITEEPETWVQSRTHSTQRVKRGNKETQRLGDHEEALY